MIQTAMNIVRSISAAAVAAWILTGCVTNPVTGKSHVQFYNTDWEKQVGSQMYSPMKQSEGADFVLDPQLTAYVREVGNRLARQSARKNELDFEFSVLNSSVPNAWALPGGKIVINRGLLTELDSEAQLAAVLGHEIIHADAAHGARQQSTGMLAQIGAVASMVVLQGQVEQPMAREVAELVPMLGAQLIMQRYGRDAEREADEYGMRYLSEAGYDPQGAVQLQEVFLKLSEGRSEDWLTGLFASHPPSRERIVNNRKTAAQLPAGGLMGRDAYQKQTAFLRRVQPAYDAFDEAREALSDGRLKEAGSLVDRALSIEPREALFHAARGDVLVQQKNDRTAREAYTRSIRENPDVFYSHLRLGQLDYRAGRPDQSRASLQRSLDLLPTAEAHYLLGEMALASHDSRSAMSHFQAAAGSDSEAGHRAQEQMVKLDLGANPGRYLAVAPGSDRSGRILLQVTNQTRLPVRNVQVQYTWLDAQGATRRNSELLRGPLAGGSREIIDTGLNLKEVGDLQQRFRAEIVSAQPAQ